MSAGGRYIPKSGVSERKANVGTVFTETVQSKILYMTANRFLLLFSDPDLEVNV